MYVESRNTALIIDQGISHKELGKRMSLRGIDSKKIKGILITHEHGDHITGVGVTSRYLGVPIYATSGSLIKMEKILNGNEKLIPIESGVSFKIGPMEIQPFSISHDASDPVQYCILSGKKRLPLPLILDLFQRLLLNESKILIL